MNLKDELPAILTIALVVVLVTWIGVLHRENKSQDEVINRQSVEISILKQELESAYVINDKLNEKNRELRLEIEYMIHEGESSDE